MAPPVDPGSRGWRSALLVGLGSIAGALFLTSCTAPIGAERVSIRQSYEQVNASAIRTGKPSASTVAILHRYDLERLAARNPGEAVRQLHQTALAAGERDLLFALAELSHVAGNRIQRSVKPRDSHEARDYYLGSAVYAWLFLFGEGKDERASAFDRRFREACDFYNYGLGLSLLERRSTNGIVELRQERRRLPVGEIEIQISAAHSQLGLGEVERVLLADHYRVKGLSVRNRQPGVGASLIGVRPLNPQFGVRPSFPVTALLRGPASLAELGASGVVCPLELYSVSDAATVAIGGDDVPLEMDLTTYRAYALSQSRIWKLGKLGFLAPAERIPSQLIPNQPFSPDRIPIVLVHGTFSSPVTWAEMANSLTADPEIRRRYQVWSFVYGSGNPMLYSAADLRAALVAHVARMDPAGTNDALRQMVVIGHSQGGLLTKAVATDTGDRLWRMVSPRPLEELEVSDEEREDLRLLTHYEPLPFVKRVVFIATPHRGSYLSSGIVRSLAHRMVSLPGAMMTRSTTVMDATEGSEVGRFLKHKIPTSLDGMSPKNPGLLAMAEIPVSPRI